MKRETGHFHAGSRRRVRADTTRRATRRAFILAAAAWPALAWAGVVHAQAPAKVPRIGFLVSESAGISPRLEAFRQGLRDLGYIEGRNIIVDYRFAEGRPDRRRDLAVELVRLKMDVIVASDGTAIRAAQAATTNIPIVMAQSIDPVDLGFVKSLAQPGGNITGLSYMAPEISAKGLELLKEAFPGISRVAVLETVTASPTDRWFKMLELTAQALRVKLQILRVADAAGIDNAFSSMAREHAGAVIVRPQPIFNQNQARIVKLAIQYRLPSVYGIRQYVDDGGLMAYGANLDDLWRRSATYVEKILKGAKPADLPVEQPTKFELVINLRTAKALGIKIPQSLLLRADKVIE